MQVSEIIHHDAASDVLYAKLPDRKVVRSAPLPDDDFVILNVDAGGEVVGVQLLEATEMNRGRWREFFRNAIPITLFEAIDYWLAIRSPA
jgi:uncharacterized protein YuzE